MVAVDGGDLNLDGSETSEHRCRVRDGNTDEIVGSYPLLTVVARDVVTRRTLPLKHRGRLRRHGGDVVRFGITQVRLPGYAEHPLWMIVVLPGCRTW